ncbi:MAG: ankyrin repeat domain-containing protein [Tepidisphaeraceae bacterium]
MAQPRPLLELLEGRRLMTVAMSSTVNFADKRQTIDGFGAAIISDEIRPENATASFFDTVVGDLGASIVRAGLAPAFEENNDNADPNTFNWAGFNEAAMKPVMDSFQRFQERGVNRFMLSVWSAPWWQKTNMTLHSGGNVRTDKYAEFAETMAAYVIAAKRDFGVYITDLSLQNEQNFIEGYVSGFYSPTQMRDLLRAVQVKFAKEGLSYVNIVFNEDMGTDQQRWQWYNNATLQDPETKDFNGEFGSHYAAQWNMADQWASIDDSGKGLWYSELSGKSSTWDAGVRTSIELADALNVANISAQLYWQFSYSLTNASDPASNTAALMTDGKPNPKYYAMKHFYRYVRPGAQRVTTTNGTDLVKINAFTHDSDGSKTIVITNNDRTNDYTLTLNLQSNSVGSWKEFLSTQDAYWQTKPNVNGTTTLKITVPKFSMITLTNAPELPVASGKSGTQYPIAKYIDASVDSFSPFYFAIGGQMSNLQRDVNSSNVNMTSWDGWTLLDGAAASPWDQGEQALRYLISKGGNVNSKTTTDGFTPLHILAMNQMNRWRTTSIDGQTSGKANALIDAGANVNAVDKYGRTPLMYAAMYVKLRGVNEDSSLVSTLLARGANKNLKDIYGKSAYDYALESGQEKKAALLLGPDTQKPLVRYGGYKADRKSVELTITENVTGSLTASDLTLKNLTTGQTLAASGWSLTDTFATGIYNSGITAATIKFASTPADGKWQLTIPAGAFTDLAGNPNAAYSYGFTVLNGDANGDGKVGFADIVALAQGYGRTGQKFSQGDFNYDGVVSFSDLLIMAQQYGKSLGTTAAAMTSTPVTASIVSITASSADKDEAAVNDVLL